MFAIRAVWHALTCTTRGHLWTPWYLYVSEQTYFGWKVPINVRWCGRCGSREVSFRSNDISKG